MEENTTKNSISQKNKRIAKNTLLLYIRTIIIMIVTLYTSRVVLNTLGVIDFGIYNVVGGIVVMFGFLNSSMSSATQRFLSFDMGRKDYDQLRRTFNASLFIHLSIAIIILFLAETIGLWLVNNYLKIPLDRIEAAKWVYQFSIFSFIVTIIRVPFNSLIIAHERMNFYAYISIFEVIFQLLAVFTLTLIAFDKLKLYAVLFFVVTVIVTLIYIIYSRNRFEETKYEKVNDKKLFKSLISFSGWSIYGSGLALMTANQGINILLNFFFGPIVNTARSIAYQINSAIFTFVSNFQTAVKPQIIKSFANNDYSYMFSLVFSSSKYSFFLLFLLSLPVIMETEIILYIWLGIVPDYTILFTKLVLFNALIDSLSSPIVTAVQATGNIKKYQLIIGTLLLLVLPVSYLFLKVYSNPAIPFILNIVISIILLITRLLLWRSLMFFSIKRYLVKLITKIIPVIIMPILFSLMIINLFESSIIRLLINIIICVSTSLLSIYFFGLSSNEKEVIKKRVWTCKSH